MPVLNPQLREPGSTPGSAKYWSIVSSCAATRIAAFGPSPESASEGFERWVTLSERFAEGELVLAFFDFAPRGYESFSGWNAGAFLQTLPLSLLESCSFSEMGTEHFEGWSGLIWARSWDEVTSASTPLDDFEGWLAPTLPALAAGAFAPVGDPVETFEATWPALKAL